MKNIPTNLYSQINTNSRRFVVLKIRRRAFTLVEMLTVVFLGMIIIMAAYSVYLMSYKSYNKNFENSELTQNARITMERMTREIRQASEIVTILPEVGTNPGSSEIKFQDGHTTDQVQYITYYLSGTDVKRKISHYYFAAYPDDWVTWSAKDGNGNSPLEEIDMDEVKAQKIISLNIWNDAVITLAITASNGTNSFLFETKILARNAQ